VARFISPPPSSVEGFQQFIASTFRQRSAGTYVCFAVTLKGSDTAIGIFQVRGIDRSLETAEWGFASDRRTGEPACSRTGPRSC